MIENAAIRLAGFFIVFHKRDLSSHDTPGLDPDGIFYRNGMGDLIYKSDSDLHVCFLQSSVGSAESLIDLGLDILCLVDQLHHFTDQDITLFVHKLIALFGKSQRVFCKYEISLGWKGIRIHKITSLTDGFSVILIQNFGIDTVELFSWKKAKKLPALIQSFDDASILCF